MYTMVYYTVLHYPVHAMMHKHKVWQFLERGLALAGTAPGWQAARVHSRSVHHTEEL
jgi:hypothetical protein